MRLSSTLDLLRSVWSCRSLDLNRASSWPLERRASASSSLNWAILGVVALAAVALDGGGFSAGGGDVDVVVSGDEGVEVWDGEEEEDSFCARTAFSASRDATRSASWEPRRRGRGVVSG